MVDKLPPIPLVPFDDLPGKHEDHHGFRYLISKNKKTTDLPLSRKPMGFYRSQTFLILSLNQIRSEKMSYYVKPINDHQ